jgi:hypothetical protein
VDAAPPDSPPETTYVYDPFGGTTVSGATNSWPFQYHGLEHEVGDVAQLDYSGGGRFYNPQIQRGLSETGPAGTSGAPSGPGPSAAGGSLGGGGSGDVPINPTGLGPPFSIPAPAAPFYWGGAGASLGYYIGSQFTTGAEVGFQTYGPVGALIGGAVGVLGGILEDIFGGGGGTPEIPRKLQHGPNQLYPVVTAINPDLTPGENSSAPKAPGGTVYKGDTACASGLHTVQEVVPDIPELPEVPLEPGEPEPSPPYSFGRRPVTYGRCLDAAEHPTLWANLCRDMPNSQLKEGCWRALLKSAEDKRGFCRDLFAT